MYTYKAKIASVYDGDTIRVDIDLGFNIIMKNESVRLYGIDTPELRGEEKVFGYESKNKLLEYIPVGSEVLIQTIKDSKEKYGRYLGIIFVNGVNINEEMVKNGYAVEYLTE
jgi:micrococcal nuclease